MVEMTLIFLSLLYQNCPVIPCTLSDQASPAAPASLSSLSSNADCRVDLTTAHIGIYNHHHHHLHHHLQSQNIILSQFQPEDMSDLSALTWTEWTVDISLPADMRCDQLRETNETYQGLPTTTSTTTYCCCCCCCCCCCPCTDWTGKRYEMWPQSGPPHD